MIGSFIKKQFIDVIEWPNPENDVLMWRFPATDQEIQNGAVLVVRESQMAVVRPRMPTLRCGGVMGQSILTIGVIGMIG